MGLSPWNVFSVLIRYVVSFSTRIHAPLERRSLHTLVNAQRPRVRYHAMLITVYCYYDTSLSFWLDLYPENDLIGPVQNFGLI